VREDRHVVATPGVKVLSVVGWCRNGSTIIGNILNEVPGIFHVGELHFLWKNAAGKGVNNWCGCGSALTECQLWSQILPLARPAQMSLAGHASEVIRRQLAAARTRHTWRVLRRGVRGGDARAHADLMAATYHAIAQRTGASVLVDTTKIVGEAALTAHMAGITPCFLHLVRDPRAVAESWRERKQYVYTMPASVSTAYWHGYNLAAHALTRRYPGRSMFLRYEDFIACPQDAIGAVLRLCGAGDAPNPVHGRVVELHTNHTVTGNPDRFRTGPTVIRDTDDAWRAGLPAPARLAAAALSWPLLPRYGYSYRGTPPGRGRAAPAAPPRAAKER
jgi:sulfotransferase family protein